MMKSFTIKEINEAYEHSLEGGQALHLHNIVFNESPSCFKAAVNRGEDIGHLFDLNLDRLIKTARQLGVKIIKVEGRGHYWQHIDLCGKPLKRAMELCLQ